MGKKFVLHTDWFAKKIVDPLNPNSKSMIGIRSAAFNKEINLCKGSMLEELGSEKLNNQGMLNLRCLDQEGIRVTCDETVLHEISLFQAEVLVAVSPVQDRLKILEDRMWLREAAMIMVGSHVYVDVDENQPIHGIVRYCGPVPEIGKGIMFGVELMERPELGNCDGSIKFKHYFNTRSTSGKFMAINKLRLLQDRRSFNPCSITPRPGSPIEAKIGLSTPESSVPPPPPPSLIPPANCRLQPISLEKACVDGATLPPLRLHDKVVWISDTGPEYGFVKWLGKLPDVGTDWMVGVEFDNPVGSGTGKYNDLQLFEAKLNHASLVPIIGLMKAEDFLGDKNFGGSTNPSSTPPRPTRKKKAPEYQDTINSGISTNTSTTNGPGGVAPLLQPTYSSLPRDFNNKGDYYSTAGGVSGGGGSVNVSPHGSLTRRQNTPPPSLVPGGANHTRSHSASLCTTTGYEGGNAITSLYSTVDKTSKHTSSMHRDKMSNHGISSGGSNLVANNHHSKSGTIPLLGGSSSEVRCRPDDLYHNGSKSTGASPGLPRKALLMSSSDDHRDNKRHVTRVDMTTDSGGGGLVNNHHHTTSSSSTLPNHGSSQQQSFYLVNHEDCLLPKTNLSSSSSSAKNNSSQQSSTVNPLYEISNRKNNSLKMGTTRLDDTIDSPANLIGCHHPSDTPTSASTVANSCGVSSKKLNVLISNGSISNNNNNNNTMLNHTTSSLAHTSGAATISNPSNHSCYPPSLVGGGSSELEVGSVVEVSINGEPCYGVIQWIGIIPEDQNNKLVAGIDMEEENPGCTDGTFNQRRYFQCQPRKAFFVRLSQCRKDGRFLESEKRKSAVFGSIDCPSVSGDVPPLGNIDKMKQLCGKNRGIQGHHNSCYLDATLFAMFSCTNVFDSLLHRPQGIEDIAEYGQVQRVLKEEIVNPLRANLYVRADRVMKLRTLLDKLSSVSGLMSEEKDPEEFLNSLLNQILKAEPFLKLSSSQEAYFYQLFVEKDEKLVLPTVQQLFDQSFLASDIKLREIPPCLLIQMPRFGKQFKMYPRILPSLYLDITDVLDDSPRQCSVCGQVAEFECKECFEQLGTGLDSTAFCHLCIEKTHSHKKRSKHKCVPLNVPSEFRMLKEHMVTIPRVYMELFAILCIETSHYVSFVKYGSGPDAPWVFFDSMADRKGEINGYNIPEISSFPDLKWYLSDEGTEFLTNTKDDRLVPEIPRRLLCDAYMCLYQSPEVMMYR